MSTVLIISGSPSEQSRTDGVLSHVGRRLTGAGHRVANLVLRDLPAAALLALDVREPRIAQAVAHVADADGIVLGSPIYKAAYSGLAKAFLDVLPQNAFREKSVLPVVTGGSPAHVLAVDYALRPVLTSLGAGHVGQGWFVLSGHVQLFPDGGVLLDPAAAGPLSEVTDAYVRHLGTRSAANLHCGTFGSSKTDVQVRRVRVDDPVLAPLMADLVVEYGTRYGRPPWSTELSDMPAADFLPPHGALVVVTRCGETVAGGALRRKDSGTAEIQRISTMPRHRRTGLGRRVLVELETAAVELGYSLIYLTTGPRQPEAGGLFLATGYRPHFNTDVDPESVGEHRFTKSLSIGQTEQREFPAIRSETGPVLAEADR